MGIKGSSYSVVRRIKNIREGAVRYREFMTQGMYPYYLQGRNFWKREKPSF